MLYNFFRPHMSLKEKTPAEVAGIKAPVANWAEVVKQHGTQYNSVALGQAIVNCALWWAKRLGERGIGR